MSEIDIQCSKILKGLVELDKYLDEPITKDALELDQNSLTTKSKELLQRLKISMAQYSERGKNLVYIGFMGHFSTGKSSTINSLLKLKKGSKERRTIGLNPVDKTVTLITHEKNKNSMINVTREGLVPIRSTAIENDFLDNIVIADTPGTGDPILVRDIAKDFLPICDLIIYFFNSTNPLDTSDEPLLKEKFSHLAFIPTKFVITRADEFKEDRTVEFGEKNFDADKANVFLGAFIQRMNQLFQYEGVSIDSNDIFLIDNEANFQIDKLRSFIEKFSDQEDISSQVRIHSHKISYFQNSANTLKIFFSDFLAEKVVALSNFVLTANENINRFNGAIQITNNSLTQFWTDSFEHIQHNRDKAIKALPEPIEIPQDLVSSIHSPESLNQHILIERKMKKEVGRTISELIKKGKGESSSDIKKSLSILKNAINASHIENIMDEKHIFTLLIPPSKLKNYFKEEASFKCQSVLAEECYKLVNKRIKKFDDNCKSIGDNIESLGNLLGLLGNKKA